LFTKGWRVGAYVLTKRCRGHSGASVTHCVYSSLTTCTTHYSGASVCMCVWTTRLFLGLRLQTFVVALNKPVRFCDLMDERQGHAQHVQMPLQRKNLRKHWTCGYHRPHDVWHPIMMCDIASWCVTVVWPPMHQVGYDAWGKCVAAVNRVELGDLLYMEHRQSKSVWVVLPEKYKKLARS
jgi:hypothetical protein